MEIKILYTQEEKDLIERLVAEYIADRITWHDIQDETLAGGGANADAILHDIENKIIWHKRKDRFEKMLDDFKKEGGSI